MRIRRAGAALLAAGTALVLGIAGLGATAAPAGAVTRSDASASSAIAGVWAWGNPIEPSVDPRGDGEPAFAPKALARFAAAHSLRTVYLSVPWAADQGPFSPWLRSAVSALHHAGVTTVAALGGDPAWAQQPDLAATWTTDALKAAPFDAVQFDVEPWVGATDDQLPGTLTRLAAMYDRAAAAAGSVPVGADLPWWLAAKPAPDGTTLFHTLLPHLRSVAIVAFSDHASGDDGIIALARPAATAAATAHVPFTIGVETDSPEVAGGPAATFGDDTAAALESQSALVRSAFGRVRGYSGVTVEHLLSWQALLAR